MALTPRSGFSGSTSGRNDVANEIPNSQSDLLNNMPFVTDVNLNKFAIDSTAYPNTTKMIVGFMRGKRVLVTYYRGLKQGSSNMRTNIADYPTSRNVLDNEYSKILNLEITLPKDLDFVANPENASIDVSGEAMLYPNMNPSNGDIFTMGLGDGRVGVFQVSSVQPMSWRSDTIFAIKFTLQSFMGSEDIDPIEGSVVETFVFQKENYLGNTVSLLKESTYLNLETIKAFRSNILKFYHNQFFNSDLCSYFRPDGIYDPHMVKFLSTKITLSDIPVRPKLLTGSMNREFKETVLGRLHDRFNTSLKGIASQFRVVPYKNSRMGVFTTELSGYSLVSTEIGLDGYSYYIFSNNFYNEDLVNMSEEEKMFHTAIKERKSGDLSALITEYLEPVFNLEPDEQFYKIPLYVHLIDMALQSQYREIDAPSMNYASTGD